MITLAESLEERPIDRDYNTHGGLRITQPEILGGGYCILRKNCLSRASCN